MLNVSDYMAGKPAVFTVGLYQLSSQRRKGGNEDEAFKMQE